MPCVITAEYFPFMLQDEICKSIAEKGGIDAILRRIDDSGEQGNKAVAKVCCSLLSKLAGSDANKSTIVGKGGMDKLIKLSARFADDPSVLQEIMSIILVTSLFKQWRNPENRQASVLIMVTLLAHFLLDRTILLNNGIEKYIRKAKQTHSNCTDGSRDLELDNFDLYCFTM
ncbi:hypothetical protein GmHk_20G056646 [Glycine max]|nr:hypothetical protein GmHk_20G056646 [Glycine max]